VGLTSKRDVVLLLTHSGDYFTVDRVAAALKRRGVRPFRFDTDRFPAQVTLTASFDGAKMSHVIEDGAHRVAATEVRAVWARRFWPPQLAPDLDPNFHAMCTRESMAAVEGFLDGFHSVRWVNEPGRDREAENKLLQLRLAGEVGLLVPRTLVTNNPQQMRDFFREVKGNMVAKLLRPVSVSMNADSGFVHTSVVTKKDLDEGDLLRHSPMVFQELITKACELRIAIVEDNLFVGSIDAGNSSGGQVDWRLASPEEVRWELGQVPDQVATAIKALMSKLGLVYGAIDLIRTPNNDYVFLEVNPGGEWGMLERDLNYPISEAIVDALLREK
jgi:MvdC family ATP-grasp ribosomal peptide maturase